MVLNSVKNAITLKKVMAFLAEFKKPYFACENKPTHDTSCMLSLKIALLNFLRIGSLSFLKIGSLSFLFPIGSLSS